MHYQIVTPSIRVDASSRSGGTRLSSDSLIISRRGAPIRPVRDPDRARPLRRHRVTEAKSMTETVRSRARPLLLV